MITQFLSKLKSIFLNTQAPAKNPVVKKTTVKTKQKPLKASKSSKSKRKKDDVKKLIENLKSLPGVGSKSAEAFYKAGFKTPESIKSAKNEDLLSVPGVGVNLVKKLKNLK